LLQERPDVLHPVTAQIIGAAKNRSAADAFRGFYRLKELTRSIDSLLEGIDLLCVPTIPRFYTCAELEQDPFTPNSVLGTYTNFVNLLDMCGISVPSAKRSDGRPGSITLLGRSGADAQAASLAAAFERDRRA
jgi:allophanate hydrolase